MRILGLSYKQLRVRLAALARGGNLLDKQVVKSANGRLEYSPAVLEMLRDLAPLAQGPGKDNGQAARELSQKIHEDGDKSGQGQTGKPGNLEALKVEIRYLKQTVEDLRRDRDNWQRLTVSLQAQLALPAPKPRRRWFARLWPLSVQAPAE